MENLFSRFSNHLPNQNIQKSLCNCRTDERKIVKRNLFLSLSFLFLAMFISQGCRAQMTTPPIYTCGTTFTLVNQPKDTSTQSSITALAYAYVPPVGPACYEVQAWAIIAPATTYQASAISNVVMVTTTAALPQVNLAWNEAGNPTGYGYIVGYAPATLVPAPLAPVLNQGTALVKEVRPALFTPPIEQGIYAKLQIPTLTVRAQAR